MGWNWLAGTTSGMAADAESDIAPLVIHLIKQVDVVLLYTGTGTSAEGVPHGLEPKPKWYMVKRTDTTGSWQYTHNQILM